jgi:hypothetical protein
VKERAEGCDLMAVQKPQGLVPRVSVLEVSVERVQGDVSALRNEAREGFTRLTSAIDRLLERQSVQEARAPRQTNWYAVAGFVVAAVTITGAIFSLAEWRVSTAFSPLVEAVRDQRQDLREARKEQIQLRIEVETQKAIRGTQSKLPGDASFT